MKKLSRIVLVLMLVLSMLVCACGGDEGAEQEGDKSATVVELPTEARETTTQVPTTEAVATEVQTEAPATEGPTTEEATTSEPVAQSITVQVNGTHYIGDTLTATDFIVVVAMSDETTKTNPEGWTADSWYLGESENEITITYQDVVTTVVVYASEQPTEAPTEATTEAPAKSVVEETEDPNRMDYILNKNTKVFHYPGCGSVKKMKESNKIYFTGTRDEVIARGYKSCGNCHP